MADWKIIGHSDDQVTIEFEDGTVLNYNAASLIPPKTPPVLPPLPRLPDNIARELGISVAGTAYHFASGGVLSPHQHDASSIHNIECVEGRVLVKREKSGDIEIAPGQTIDIEIGEIHSVHALEPSKTVHWLKPQ